jgi:hypothetical protein
MGWSFKLGRILGITFRVHLAFVLLLLLVFLSALPIPARRVRIRASWPVGQLST